MQTFGLCVRLAERFSASDLRSDGSNPDCNHMVLMSLSKTLYHNCFSPHRSKWVPVRAELVVEFD